MKRTKTSAQLKAPSLMKFLDNELVLKTTIYIVSLLVLSALLWMLGPTISLYGYAPLAQPTQRLYAIATLFLLWLLKFLIVDLDDPYLILQKDPQIRERLQGLQSRFKGALQFLKKTTVANQEKSVRLSQLPWYLLLGPKQAGKTSLLANSKVNFILQRQFPNQDIQQLPPSEHCDWWITREASIVDVPGNYLSLMESVKNSAQKKPINPLLWRCFLRLIKKKRGAHGIDGIILALPLPELLKDTDSKKYYAMLRNLFQRVHEIKKFFPHPLSCYIVITKCDLLPGFKEFFAEFGHDELAQAWGVSMPELNQNEKVQEIFNARFNALIKKLNQQLLWRLHQERNPLVRPYIKDFPLQIERIRELIEDFIKRLFSSRFNLKLNGVYLTSSTQDDTDEETNVVEEPLNTTQRAVQIFKEPRHVVRAYFIRQLLMHGFSSNLSKPKPIIRVNNLKQRVAFAVSLALIGYAAFVLGSDFKDGVNQAYSVQQHLVEYKLLMQKTQDANEKLGKTVALLNHLEALALPPAISFDVKYLLSFYSHQSQQRTYVVYRQALKTIFIPEIKNYFEAYLKHAANQNVEIVYAALKTYLMFGDKHHFQSDFVLRTLNEILPTTTDPKEFNALFTHLKLAVATTWEPIALNMQLVQKTRKILTAVPNLQLSYVILKNINYNNRFSPLHIVTNQTSQPVLSSNKSLEQIPSMFTANAFANIVRDEASIAATEATLGNWVLGDTVIASNPIVANNQELTTVLAEQLRIAYVTTYIETWENILASIQLANSKNLKELDAQLIELVSNDSPLLLLLQTIREQTYFEPILSSSPKLQSLGMLWDKSSTSKLPQIISSLQNLHLTIQSIVSADDTNKAAFEMVSHRMLTLSSPDAIMQVRIAAEQSPEPIKSWLHKIANDSWRFLMQDSGRYIDTSWQEKVSQIYQNEIANRYPFSAASKQEVELNQFIAFFGNPGIIMDFYNQYLQAFVDNTTPDWRWKKLDEQQLPFSDETLRHIHQALQIHRVFFPKSDNKLNVQFALQPYQFGKEIQRVKLNINDKEIIDENGGKPRPHVVAWPSDGPLKNTTIQLFMSDQKMLQRDYPGDWGWFKLVNQSFESIITKKELLLNLSMNEHPAKYLLFTPGQFNPFLSLNLRHFVLPTSLAQQKA